MTGLRSLGLGLLLALLPLGARADVSLAALIEEALLPRFEASLPEGARLEIDLPPEAPKEVKSLAVLEYDRANQSFVVTPLLANGPTDPYRGKIRAVVDALVPVRPILPGEKTAAEDFEWRSLPAQNMSRFVLTSPEQILGREARRLLPQGRPVQAQSLQEPRLIRRGQKIELVYERGGLHLTAPAKALEDGAEGDVIRVQNLNSNRTVKATPAGDGRVMVVQ